MVTIMAIAQSADVVELDTAAAEPQQQQTYTVKKLGQKGYCEDWKYLPEGKYPKQLNKGGDAVQECAMRSSKPFGSSRRSTCAIRIAPAPVAKGSAKRLQSPAATPRTRSRSILTQFQRSCRVHLPRRRSTRIKRRQT